jgi:SynChlorMet cassette radical SAM/SPASM protein ScmF
MKRIADSKNCKKSRSNYLLRQIYFYLTKACNLRCRHCWIDASYQIHEKNNKGLRLELFCSIIQQAKPLGLKAIKLTGGEPLLHPHFNKILDVVRKEKIGLAVETNGTLCTHDIADRMAACDNAIASVSIDGANAETHEWVRGVKGCFDAALEGINNLVQVGIKTQVIMTLLKRNRSQMEEVARLVETLGADSVKFNIVHPISKGEAFCNTVENLSLEELIEIGIWVETGLSKFRALDLA